MKKRTPATDMACLLIAIPGITCFFKFFKPNEREIEAYTLGFMLLGLIWLVTEIIDEIQKSRKS